MSALAVDKDNKRAQSVHVATYDLNEPDQLAALVEFIVKHQSVVLWAHFAPSCGTASRARGRPLPKLAKMGVKVPQPLRSDEQPMGLDGLAGLDKVKAESANITYDSTCHLVRLCVDLGIAVSIENPANSLFWKMPAVVQLLRDIDGHMTNFDNCCHGGTRQKATGWWANVDWFNGLAAKCDNSHFHEKWNAEVSNGQVVFPTHLEAAYPILLCQRLASIAKLKALEHGAIQIHTLQEQVDLAPSSQHRILLDMLPRGRKFKPLVSEYGQYQRWAIAVPGNHDQQLVQSFPKGAKVVHRQFEQGLFRVDGSTGDVYVHDSCKSPHKNHEIVTVGVPREPLDFLARAVEAGHPRSVAIHLTDSVKQVLTENFAGDDYELSKKRAKFLWKWSNRAKELAKDESAFHEKLPLHLKHLLKGKRLLLLKEVLEDLQYPDTTLVDEIAHGFTLHGWMTESGVFPKETKRPEYTTEMVKNMAKGLNKAVYKQVCETGEDELSQKTWESTLDELDKQWVWRDVHSDFTEVILAKRFGLQQKAKVRVIDDCSVGGYNKSYGTKEKLRVHAIDQLAAYLSWLCTELGPAVKDDVVGRTYDLRSAYKQFGVSESTRNLLRLIVWDVEQKTALFAWAERPTLWGFGISQRIPTGQHGSLVCGSCGIETLLDCLL